VKSENLKKLDTRRYHLVGINTAPKTPPKRGGDPWSDKIENTHTHVFRVTEPQNFFKNDCTCFMTNEIQIISQLKFDFW
jgi:hypothetical protein